MRASIVYFSILASLVASANALEIAPARRGVAILSRNNDVDRVDKVDVDRRSGVDKVDVDRRSGVDKVVDVDRRSGVDKVDVDKRVDKVDVDKRSAISIDFFEPTPSVISAASLESAFGTTSWAVISPAPAPTNNPANVD
ncbi:hypothetical protein C370_06733 [Cryptococcus neoformans A1-35-8]|nr:hypothetical protein C369_06671 [Cryptococcus neoformans var. grubii A5-35-17]OXH02828.1 hypothetical protein C370_06733 [Cryptococcus neoformans var. grubii A1-35-8]